MADEEMEVTEAEAIEWVRTDMAFAAPETHWIKAELAIDRFPEHAEVLFKWFAENYPELKRCA